MAKGNVGGAHGQLLSNCRPLYKIGPNEILQRYVPNFERNNILAEAHGGAVGGNYAGETTTHQVLRAGLWWLMLH